MRKHLEVRRRFALAAMAAAAALAMPAVQAQETPILDQLLDKLKDRGILTEDEYQALKAEREAERLAARAERRQRALREAQAAEKEEKSKDESKTALAGRFRDGFIFESGDRQHGISVSGRVHGDYRHFADDTAPRTFDVRRAYLGIQGKLYDIYTFDVTGDFAQSGTTLDVAWFNAAWLQSAQLRVGQFKMPFSIEEQTSSRFIDFQERSTMNALVPAKERGIMVHGEPFKGLNYGVALSNGQGKNNNETSVELDRPDLIARVSGNAAEWLQQPGMVLHAGLAYSNGTLAGNSAVPSGRTEARGVTFFQAGNLASSAGTDVDRQRLGGELSLAWGPFKLQGEYTRASFDSDAGSDRDIDAYYASASWLVTGESHARSYRSGAYRAIAPNRPLGSGGLGAFEVGLRYSDFDAGDFTVTAPTASTAFTNKADAWTLGLKWIPVTNVRVYLNYVQTQFDTPIRVNGENHDYEKAVTLRAALYF
ncbi:MAG: hypothetical protein IT532_18605 [Burkholderiales bacterium]|nr:hypothetical protein [Burkholderiales bacterium]